MKQMAIVIANLALLFAVGAGVSAAQESRSEVSLQGTGFYTKDSTGQGTTDRSTNTGGFLVSYRYHINRWLAAEGAYGYNRNSQRYFAPAGLTSIQSNIHQATGGFVVRVPAPARFRISPYVLAEGGALVFDPTSNNFGIGAQRQTTGVFVYGGGADFPLMKHVALRAEYRGLVYSTPDFGLSSLNTNTTTHTAQPSAGLVFRF
jgi:opacity protein-like surface antigen